MLASNGERSHDSPNARDNFEFERRLTTGDDEVSRLSRAQRAPSFLYMPGVFDSAGSSAHSRLSHAPVLLSGRSHQHPGSLVSKLNTQPAQCPIQRFQCGLAAAFTWLGARVVRYSFSVRHFSFASSFRCSRGFEKTPNRLLTRAAQNSKCIFAATTDPRF